MIERVVFAKLNAGQLDDSGLTLRDLRIMTTRLALTLVNTYHGRVRYPWQREKDLSETPKPAAQIA
jgi:membrane-associated HD superfamily phosphohydrolase